MTVSVVIVTRQRDEHLQNVLTALRRQDVQPDQVVVVVGPDSPGTAGVVGQLEPASTIAHCPVPNISAARNIGIVQARGEVIVFIDDDAVPADAHWVERAQAFFDREESRPYAALAGPVFRGDTDEMEFSAANCTVNDYGQFAVSCIDMNDRRISNRWVTRVSGANAFFRRDALLSVGGFDEQFAYYHDETDLCFRLQRMGMLTHYAEKIGVLHYRAMDDRPLVELRPWSRIARSDTYYCMKNALDSLPVRLLRAIRSLPLRHYWIEADTAVRDGKCSSLECDIVKRRIRVGWVRGLFAGLLMPRRLCSALQQ